MSKQGKPSIVRSLKFRSSTNARFALLGHGTFHHFGGVKAIALVKSNNLNCDSLQSVSCKESLFDAMQGTAATG